MQAYSHLRSRSGSGDHDASCLWCAAARRWVVKNMRRASLPYALYHTLRPGVPVGHLVMVVQTFAGADVISDDGFVKRDRLAHPELYLQHPKARKRAT